jgi:uncharacterized protein YndB with AHSA1/START domain
VPRVAASRELIAGLADAWEFATDPQYLADWWPGIAAVEADRRGLAPGARWRVHGTNRPSFFRAPNPTGLLLVLDVERPTRFRFQLTGERIDAQLALAAAGPDRTRVTLTIEGPWLVGLSRSFPRKALERLHALCQIAAEL